MWGRVFELCAPRGFLVLRTRPVPGRATQKAALRLASYGWGTLTALLLFLPVAKRPMLVENSRVGVGGEIGD